MEFKEALNIRNIRNQKRQKYQKLVIDLLYRLYKKVIYFIKKYNLINNGYESLSRPP